MSGTGPMNRRTFLRLAAVSAAASGLAACGATPTATPVPPTATKPPAAPTAVPPTATKAPAAPTAVPPTATKAPAAPTAVPPTATKAPAAPTTAPAAGSTCVKTGGKFTIAEGGDINSFNPWTMDSFCQTIAPQIYSRLIWKNKDGKVMPDAATAWEWSSDGSAFTLKLRDDMTWHDGKPFTADDIVTMYKYSKDPDLAKTAGVAKIAGLLNAFKDVVAADKYTVKILFDKPAAYVLDILDYWFIFRIDDKADPDSMKKLPNGTGPFQIVEWKPKEYTRLIKYKNYKGARTACLDELVFTRPGTPDVLYPLLKAGSVDGINNVTTSLLPEARKNTDIWLYTWEHAWHAISINLTKAPLSNPEVRRALNYTFNRASIQKDIFNGMGTATSSPWYTPASIAFRQDLKDFYTFDLKKAKEMLDKAGAKDLKFTIITCPLFMEWKQIGLLWQSDLAQIGVKLEISEVDQAKWTEIRAKKDLGGYDFITVGIGRSKRDPAILVQTQAMFFPGEKNQNGWVNNEYTKLVADASIEIDQDKRQKMYQRINEIVVKEDCPLFHLQSMASTIGFQKHAKGYFTDLLDVHNYWQAYVDK